MNFYYGEDSSSSFCMHGMDGLGKILGSTDTGWKLVKWIMDFSALYGGLIWLAWIQRCFHL